jgi:hypothetical protein
VVVEVATAADAADAAVRAAADVTKILDTQILD